MSEIIETLAAEVHKSWMIEKRKQGFHAPMNCLSKQHKHFQNSPEYGKNRFEDAGFDEKTYKWCKWCHTDMYSYSDLPENVKEYDRVTVKTVLKALGKIAETE